MKQYKLGKALFSPELNGKFVWERKHLNTLVSLYESELLEMGAQLVEEEKPQEIEKISHFMMGLNEKILAEKLNEVIEAFTIHLSACGKEK